MKKGLSWILITLIAAIGIVGIVSITFVKPSKFGEEAPSKPPGEIPSKPSSISTNKIREFLRREAQEPENYILEQKINVKTENYESLDSVTTRLERVSELEATYKVIRRGEFGKKEVGVKIKDFGTTIEMVTAIYTHPNNQSYECQKGIFDIWSCKKIEYAKIKPDLWDDPIFLEESSIGALKYYWDLENVLESVILNLMRGIEIDFREKSCFGRNCICADVDATEIFRGRRAEIGEYSIDMNKFLIYGCIEENSKVTLEMKGEMEAVNEFVGKKYIIKQLTNVTTIRFEEGLPPLDEFNLPSSPEQ